MAFNYALSAWLVAVVLFQVHVSLASPVILEAAESGVKEESGVKQEGEVKNGSTPELGPIAKEEAQGLRLQDLKEEEVAFQDAEEFTLPEISVSVKISLPNRRAPGHPRFGPRPGGFVIFEDAPDAAKPDGEQNKTETEQEKKEGAKEQEKQEKATEQKKQEGTTKEDKNVDTIGEAKLASNMESEYSNLATRDIDSFDNGKYVQQSQSI